MAAGELVQNLPEAPSGLGLILTHNQSHVYLWIKSADEGAFLADHMAEEVRVVEYRPKQGPNVAVRPPIPPEQFVNSMLGFLDSLRGEEIEFGFNEDVNLDENGLTSESHKENVGLTCVLLVVAAFRSVGFEIVEIATWPELSANDKNIFEGFLMNGKYPHSDQTGYWMNVLDNERCMRVTPKQVFAAGLLGLFPTPFEDAECCAAQL